MIVYFRVDPKEGIQQFMGYFQKCGLEIKRDFSIAFIPREGMENFAYLGISGYYKISFKSETDATAFGMVFGRTPHREDDPDFKYNYTDEKDNN